MHLAMKHFRHKTLHLVLNLLLLLVHFFGLSFFHGYIFLLFFNM